MHKDFGLKELVFVGDRGMITKTRIAELRALEGAGWVTALKAPDIAALAADGGPLQLSLFDEQNLAEISHPDYPGERLVCCRNPALEESRRLKREALLAATEADLEKIRASVAAGRLKDTDKIGIRVGKVIGKHKVGKHFTWEITGDGFTFRRDQDKIAAEAAARRDLRDPHHDHRGDRGRARRRPDLQEPQIRGTGFGAGCPRRDIPASPTTIRPLAATTGNQDGRILDTPRHRRGMNHGSYQP